MRLRILPYKPGSRSAKFLARALNGLRVRFNGSFRPNPRRHLVVNWGNSNTPSWWGLHNTRSLNHPERVRQSSNKLIALQLLKQNGVSVPEFTNTKEAALAWCREGAVVVARTILTGHSGAGCRVWTKEQPVEELANAPLYTKHLRHKREFRIHVFNGAIIDQAEKLRKRGFEDRNSWIRNHDNGWVFCRGNIQVPDVVRQEAVKACQVLGLDFGAVDVAYREKENRAFVFEVNTAPGMEGQTINSYVQAIQRLNASI